MTARGRMTGLRLDHRYIRWLIFLVILLAVMAYVSWHGGESAQWARSFLRHLLRALF